jgi:hypothetical protein
VHHPTCRVVFRDGTPCPGTRKYTSGLCVACYAWSANNGGQNPEGRGSRSMKAAPCPTVYDNGTPCPNQAQPTSGWCRTCFGWSKRNGGQSPQGRRHTGSGRKRVLGQCATEGCSTRATARDLCGKHYGVLKGTGVMEVPERELTEREQFVQNASQAITGECIILTAESGKRPMAMVNGQSTSASRAVWMLANGDPGELYVLHTCHRGDDGCINIRHLYLGTHQRNGRDMAEALRTPVRKLEPDDVREVRRLLAVGRTQTAIAHRFGVSQGAIQSIASGRTWSWLK